MLIPDEIRKCATFIGFKNSDGTYSIRGTAFFVIIPFNDDEKRVFIHVVTAKHIIARLKQNNIDKAWLRINTIEGFEWVETNVESWYDHPEDYRVDASVLPLYLSPERYDYLALPISMAATDQVIKQRRIDVGDEVFLTGLFTEHNGRKKNLPIVRTGSIALMPEEPIGTKILGVREEIDAYLIEARSIGGLSGSPVFVHMGSVRPHLPENRFSFAKQPSFYWLGLMHGHWDVDIRNDESEEDDTSVPPQERVNMGIAMVVPVERILEVINHPILVDLRKRIEQQEIDPLIYNYSDEGEDVTFEEDYQEIQRRAGFMNLSTDPKSSDISD